MADQKISELNGLNIVRNTDMIVVETNDNLNFKIQTKYLKNEYLIGQTTHSTVNHNNLVYLNNDNIWYNATAISSSKCDGLLGLSYYSSSIFLRGYFENFTNLETGSKYYVGTDTGSIQNYEPTGSNEIVREIGRSFNTSSLYFDPSSQYIELI